MGTMTLTAMCAEVYFAMGERNETNPGTVAGLAFLTERIRDAYRHVCSPKVFDHPVLHNLQHDIVLGAGTAENHNVESFTLPTRLRAIEVARNETDGYKFNPDRFDQFMDRGVAPRMYARRGMRIYLPTSEGTNGNAARVHYWGRPDVLTTTTEIGEEWDSIIVQLAISFAFGRLRQTALADYHQSIAAALINDQLAEGNLEAGQTGWSTDLSDQDPYQARS